MATALSPAKPFMLPLSSPNSLDRHLAELVTVALAHPIGSLERQRTLTQLIAHMQQSGKIWQGSGARSEDYAEALQQTWLFLCRNLERYDSSKASLMTWFNNHLKYRLLDQSRQTQQTQQETLQARRTKTGEWCDPLDALPAQATMPLLLEEIEQWLTQDSKSLRLIHLRDRSEVHCQMLIRCRLPPETPWEQLSQRWNVPISTLSNFYQRECLPRLRAFVDSLDYADSI
ncbi:MAG: hypothetical protein VKJ24_22175 [Synechococcales bacterium]|nr:hypothetical protein [Synechococcales bacterium]